MQIKLSAISHGTQVEFLSKAIHGANDTRISIRVVAKDGSMIFAKNSFASEDFEFTSWTFDTALTEAYLQIDDASSHLLLEYFIIYNLKDVFEAGVSFLRRENNCLYLDEKSSLGEYYQRNIYRPQYHFSAYKNWINDPNGLIFYGGYYHLFYQYYPHQAEWGNMHWGHAVSKDAVSWRHLPIALLPQIKDQFFGGSFSGSAIEKDQQLTLIYTHHFEDARNKIKFKTSDFIENQELATSNDGVNFIRRSNPVLYGADRPKEASKDFRDPKVWLDKDNKYKMILGSSYEQQLAVLIYSSEDLISWDFEGPLYIEKNLQGRCIECPDLFPLGDKYILFASVIENIAGVEKHITRYHIGSYANNRFISQYSEIIDFGPSFYAIQTFEHNNERIGIAWLDSWQDNKKSVAKEFAGVMSLPFTLRLAGNKLQIKPLSQLDQLRKLPMLEFNLDASDSYYEVNPHSAFELKLRLKMAPRSTHDSVINLRLVTGSNQEFINIQLNLSKGEIEFEISEHDRRVKYCHKLAVSGGNLDVHLFFDRSALEVFFADYTQRGSFRFYWQQSSMVVKLTNNAQFDLASCEIYNLKSIWGDI